jgi:2-amino-4-hydroxy-6-hydroxymethyldihydropteridine diphosphokinase
VILVDAVVVYIGLGSNIEQPFVQIKNALNRLADLPGTEVLKDSGYFISSPMGPEDQPDYVNAVTQISTSLDPSELLEQCQKIEQRQGRIKTRHWGERSIDLDILLYGDEEIDTDVLNVPHPGILQRDFVYLPLLKINPDIILPGSGMLSDLVSSTDGGAEYDCQFAGNIE